jgi:hypothetical protein
MRGQVFLEFLVAFVAVIAIVQILVSAQEKGLVRIGAQVNQTMTKMELEKITSSCNSLYLNWKSAEFNFSFSISNFRTYGDTILSETAGRNVSSRCFSNISGTTSLQIKGVKRWF